MQDMNESSGDTYALGDALGGVSDGINWVLELVGIQADVSAFGSSLITIGSVVLFVWFLMHLILD